MTTSSDFGVLYGQKTTEDALLIYSSYSDSKASPQTGDFIVLSPKNEDGIKYLARVEAEIYDEDPIFKSQDKTLIAVHYARVAQRELSERDKQKMFSYTYKVAILGTFKDTGHNIQFSTAVRKLPTVAYQARHLNKKEIDLILNKANEHGVDVGILCVGEDVYTEKGCIRFDTEKLKRRRTMVFAQSGFGKTNFIKVLLHSMIQNTSYGKLIFDLNGEYYAKSDGTYGLGDINDQNIKNNIVVYTDKEDIAQRYKEKLTVAGEVKLNMKKHLTVGDIINFGTGLSSVMENFLHYLDDNGVEDFITNIDLYVNDPQELRKKYSDFFSKNDAGATSTIAAIRKRLRPLIDEGSLHKHSSNLILEVINFLQAGKTVIVDLSLKDNREASIITTILVRTIFERKKQLFTSNAVETEKDVVIFVEEAQNVLSEEFVRSNANPFVRIAKEGRKFGIGMVTITQRPSAIAEEIRTQAENFFTFHMGNSDDIRALVKSNMHYDGVIAKFIQKEAIKGNCYMVTADQAFALPIRIFNFEKKVHDSVYSEHKFAHLN